MLAIIEANWPVIALVLGLAIVLLLFLLWGRPRKSRERHHAPDALDEGAAPAQRNQALIDAPSAATVAKIGGVGVLEREPEPVARPVSPPPPPPAPPPPPPPPPPPAPAAIEEAKLAPTPKPKVAPKLKAPPAPPARKKAESKPKAAPKPKPAPAPKAAPKPAPQPKPATAAKPAPTPKPVPVPPPPPTAPEPAAPPPPPQVEVVAPPAPAQASGGLSRIKGLGPKLQTLLPTLGVANVADIAAWSEADIDRIDALLGVFQGRIRKDNWVEQAKLLAAGDVAGYEAKFGKL